MHETADEEREDQAIFSHMTSASRKGQPRETIFSCDHTAIALQRTDQQHGQHNWFPVQRFPRTLAKFQVSLVKGDGDSAGVRAHFKSHAMQPCFGCRYIEHTSTQSSVYVCIMESELYA